MTTKFLPLIPDAGRVAQVKTMYERFRGRIRAILLDSSAPAHIGIEAAKKAARTEVMKMNIAIAKWAPLAVSESYRHAGARAVVFLETLGRRKKGKTNHAEHMRAYADSMLRDFMRANNTIVKNVENFMNARAMGTQFAARVREFDEGDYDDAVEAFESMTARAIAEGMTRKQLSDLIEKYLYEKADGGKFITIRGRNYSIESYAEMVARTDMRYAQTEAVKRYCQEYDNDLVEVSRHSNPCGDCAEIEGNIYSLSGRTEGYPLLDIDVPLHPNCEHSISPTSEAAIQVRGEYV